MKVRGLALCFGRSPLMELALQREESELLKHILSVYLSDLRMEIGRTDDYAMRQDLKREKEMVAVLMTRLSERAEASMS